MSLVRRIKQTSEKGFTIVELLIVIVVIGILATITIVSFNGIQNRAKTTKSQSNAGAIQDSAEGYNADIGGYPVTLAALKATTNVVPVPASISVVSNSGNPLAATPVTSLTAANGGTTIQYDYVIGGTGARIVYWDFGTSKPSANITYLGTATSASTFSTTP